MGVRNVTTNSSNTKLTRPKAMWKRVLTFLVGLLFLLTGLGNITADPMWLALLLIFIGGCAIVVAAAEKTETLG